jgi:hypothetical protein
MTSKSKAHTQKDGYVLSFILCILAFIEGLIFAFFCLELLQEQFEAIEVNQSYIDDMKELFGRPLSLTDNLTMALGYDWKWWLIPTRPCLAINYLEKLYTLRQIKKLRDFEEDDYDSDRKLFATEFIKSRREKRIAMFLVASFASLWFFYLRYHTQGFFEGKYTVGDLLYAVGLK